MVASPQTWREGGREGRGREGGREGGGREGEGGRELEWGGGHN